MHGAIDLTIFAVVVLSSEATTPINSTPKQHHEATPRRQRPSSFVVSVVEDRSRGGRERVGERELTGSLSTLKRTERLIIWRILQATPFSAYSDTPTTKNHIFSREDS